MQGNVEWQQLIWIVGLLIAGGAVVAGTLIGVWKVLKSELKAIRDEWAEDLAKRDKRLDDLHDKLRLTLERSKMVEDDLRRELADYRVHVAETFATKDGVTLAIGRLEGAIERLTGLIHESVERITHRVDRLIETRTIVSDDKPQPRRRSSLQHDRENP